MKKYLNDFYNIIKKNNYQLKKIYIFTYLYSYLRLKKTPGCSLG